jgi:valyl-tRNA synthetase
MKPTMLDSDTQGLLDEFHALVVDVTADMDSYKFYLVAEKLYHYVWHRFADTIIEESKEKLKSTDVNVVASTQYMLRHILKTSLALLHPFMPFITEEIWSYMPDTKKTQTLLMTTEWPDAK